MMNRRRIVLSALAASVLSLVTPQLIASTLYTWTPNPTGPYGYDFFYFNTTNGTFVTTTAGSTTYTFDFGDGANAASRPGLISDTGGGDISWGASFTYLFTANGYTLRSTTSSELFGAGVTFSVSSNVTATFSDSASGTFTKIGNGTLQLDQPYTSSTLSINQGTLALLAPQLMSGSSVITAANATFALGASNQSLVSITNNGTVTSAGAALTVTTLTNNSAITSTGGALSVNSLINNGTITTAPSTPGATDGDMTIGGLDGSGNITLNGTFLTAGVNAGQMDTYTGNLSGNGSLFKTGSSELILQGYTTLTGGRSAPDISVEAGTLAGNTNNLVGSIFVVSGATLLFAQPADGTFSGSLTSNGTVRASGLTPGTVLTFNTANPFTGNLQLGAGIILAVSADNELGSVITTQNGQKVTTFSAVAFDGGTLRTTAAFLSARPYTITQNGGTLDTDALSPTFTGTFTSTGNGTFNITGGGTATFSNVLSFNALAINQAAVAFTSGSNSAIPLTLASTTNALTLTDANLTLNFYSATTTGNISLLGNSTLTLNRTKFQSGSVFIANAAGANDSASLTGLNSNWAISGNLTLGKDAVTIKPLSFLAGMGSLTVPAFQSASVSGTTTLLANSTLSVSGNFSTGALANSASSTPTISISDFIIFPVLPAFTLGGDTAANTTYSGAITNAASSGSIHKIGANTQTFSGNNTYTGITLIDGGTLVIASNTALPAASLITNNANLTIAASNVSANILSGTGTLTLNANNRLTLAGGGASKQSGVNFNSLSILDIGANPFILEATAANKSFLLNQAFLDVQSVPFTNSGITSSTVTANPANYAIAVVDNSALATPFTTFGGQSVDATSILITPALLGDSDLSGTVDLSDLNTVLNHLGQSSNAWTSGNFDAQPTIDLTDLNDVLNHLGVTNPNPSDSLPLLNYQVPVSPASAPEPTSLLLLASGAGLLVAKQRLRRF